MNFTADFSAMFRTRFSIRFAQYNSTTDNQTPDSGKFTGLHSRPQSRPSFLASAALARGKGSHLLLLPRPRWLKGPEGSGTRMTGLLVLNKNCLYVQLRERILASVAGLWSKRTIMILSKIHPT